MLTDKQVTVLRDLITGVSDKAVVHADNLVFADAITAKVAEERAEALARGTNVGVVVATTTEEIALDGLTHHVFNTLRAETRSRVTVRTARSPVDLVKRVPAWLDVETAWRVLAAKDPAVATLLKYWDAARGLDVTDDLWVRILDGVEQSAGIPAEVRRALIDAGEQEIDGPPISPLIAAGIEDTSFDDVRAILAEDFR